MDPRCDGRMLAALDALLRLSLSGWRIAGDVRVEPDGTLLVSAGDRRLRVARAPAPLPFRWVVESGDKSRGARSVAGLLRIVRAALDKDFRPIRLRIAPLALAPP